MAITAASFALFFVTAADNQRWELDYRSFA
jgi:hypothetical protein